MAGPKRKRRGEPARPRRPLRFPIDAGLVERAVDEGVLMSRTALTMATMNHIVVGALRGGRDYDPVETAAFVDAELRALTLEQAAMAAHMRRLMAEFPPSYRRSTTISDHHLLVQRRVIYSALATELERLRLDGTFVPAAAEASRAWAWSELGHAIEVRLDARDIDPADPAYEDDRDERMRAVREVDLGALAASRAIGHPGIRSRVDGQHTDEQHTAVPAKEQHMSDTTGVEKVAELIKGFRFAMMTTRSADAKLVSRPLTVQDVEFDGNLWFIVARDSHEVAEITADAVVNVAFSSNDTWVSLSGLAEQVDDDAKLKELWNPVVEAWFTDGPDDPNVTLIRFVSDSAEYWDTPGGRIATVFSLVKSKVTGTAYDGGENEKVEL